MSVDFETQIEIGFTFDADEVSKKFGIVRIAKFVSEERFCPKTGKKMKSKKVLARPERTTHWVVENNKILPEDEDEDEDEDFVDNAPLFIHIAKICGCEFLRFGDGETNNRVIFVPKGYSSNSSRDLDCGHVFISGCIPFEDVSKTKLSELKKKLENLGLKPSRAEITNCWSIS